MNKNKGLLALLAAGFIFGTFIIWIRFLNKEINVYEQIVLRNVFTMLFAMIAIALTKQQKNEGKISPWLLAVFALVVPLSVIFYNLAALTTTVVIAIFAFYAGTIITGGVIGTFVYKEPLEVKSILSYVLALIGVSVLAFPFSALNWGLIFGLIGGVADGLANSLRKSLASVYPKFQLVMITGVAGVLLSGSILLFTQQSVSGLVSAPLWVYFLGAFFGALLVTVNYLTLIGFQNYDVGMGTIIISFELIVSTVFGMLIFKEIPSAKDIISGLFVASAIVVQNVDFAWGKRRG